MLSVAPASVPSSRLTVNNDRSSPGSLLLGTAARLLVEGQAQSQQ